MLKYFSSIRLIVLLSCMIIPAAINAQNFTDATADAATMPVKLLSFTGTKTENNNVTLNWSTASETNNEGFVIQRSLNGVEFVDLATVKGAGNASSINRYQYTDANVPAVNLYYRLKQVDQDGKTTFSSIVLIRNNSNPKNEMIVYPNPVKDDQVRLTLNMGKGRYMVSVVDQLGAVTLVNSIDYPGGTGNVQLKLPATLPAGTYLLRVTSNSNSFVQRIVIR